MQSWNKIMDIRKRTDATGGLFRGIGIEQNIFDWWSKF
jgi:hypothetical protein